MADFHEDIQSIKHLVHNAKNRTAAIKEFQNMHGFGISREQAQLALKDALDVRFPFKESTIASTTFLNRIQRKIDDHDHCE